MLLMVSPTKSVTAKSVSNSNGVTTEMAMRMRIAILNCEVIYIFKIYQTITSYYLHYVIIL